MARIVVFDLGGVLVRINRTWQAIARQCGIAIALPPEPEIFIGNSPSIVRYQVGQPLDAFLLNLAEELGVSPDQALTLHKGVLAGTYAGALEFVHEVQAAGLATACLSNTNEDHWEVMVHGPDYPAVKALPLKVASHLEGLEKPFEPFYRLLEARSGLSGQDIVFFDDLPPNVETALQLGWHAFEIDPHTETVPQMRRHLAELGWL